MYSISIRHKCRRIGWLFIAALVVLVVLPQAVQSQSTNNLSIEERRAKMTDLYNQAKNLKDNLPKRDYRGLFLTTSFGTSAVGALKTWHTEEQCDCEGNVVSVEDVPHTKVPIAASLGFEHRFASFLSLRAVGSFAQLSNKKGKNAVDENGVLTEMLDNYALTQQSLHGSILLHSGNFYGGGGVSWFNSSASGFRTQSVKPNLSAQETPQYFLVKADVLDQNQQTTKAHVFIGYRLMLTERVFTGIELGFSQNPYGSFQFTFPLFAKTKQSLQAWKQAKYQYQNLLRQAILIDMELNPQKFQTCDSPSFIYDSGNNGGGRCN